MGNYTFRLKLGQDLLGSTETFLHKKKITAAFVLTGGGSLTQAF